MIKTIQKLFMTASILVLVVLLPSSVLAVEISFEPENVVSNQGKAYSATLVLTTDNESVNAVDGTLLIDSELGNDINISDSGSIVTYWVTRPTYDSATRTVKFSGTMPGGYNGQSGILFSVILPPRTGGSVKNAISVGDAHSYLNDGSGTERKISKSSFELTSDGSGPVNTAIADQLYLDQNKLDNLPPEAFSPQLAQDKDAFDGKWFISFATIDKQSGVSYYEIQETRSGRPNAGNWKRAESPYVLSDQELHSYIYVVAVDRQGNERMIKVYPRRPLNWWQRYQRDILIFLGILVLITAGTVYNSKRNNKSKVVVK